MYNITWARGLYELVGQLKDVLELANLLEHQGKQFKISNRLGVLSQRQLNHGGFKFWIMGDFDEE